MSKMNKKDITGLKVPTSSKAPKVKSRKDENQPIPNYFNPGLGGLGQGIWQRTPMPRVPKMPSKPWPLPTPGPFPGEKRLPKRAQRPKSKPVPTPEPEPYYGPSSISY